MMFQQQLQTLPHSADYANQPHPHLKFGLCEKELADYYRDGFLLLRQRFTSLEMDEIRNEAKRLCQEADADQNNLRYHGWHQGCPWKIDPVVDISPMIARLARDRRICDALASIYNRYEPRLFKDKLVLQPPGSKGGTNLHQDYTWWRGFPRSLITVALAIDDTTLENGCTEVFTGWQRGLLHASKTGENGQIELKQNYTFDQELISNERKFRPELQSGDMLFFSCLTPHSGNDNLSESPRRMAILTYNDSRDGEHYRAHYDHFFSYMLAQIDDPIERQARFFY